MREYDLYLFDFDNTLFDTRMGINEILKHALPAVGVHYDESMFSETVGMSMDQVFEEFVGDQSKWEVFEREFMRIVNTDVYKTAVPFPETKTVLTELRARGKHVGIASGKQRFKIEELLERDGMSDLVETVVGYFDTERHKPDPEPVNLAFSRFDVPLDRAVYVGDSPNDPAAARAAGMDGIVVNRHNGLTPDGIECTFEIHSLSELTDW